MQIHPHSKLFEEQIPHFDDFGVIFGKDRATDTEAETTTDSLDAVVAEKEVKKDVDGDTPVDVEDEFVDDRHQRKFQLVP